MFTISKDKAGSGFSAVDPGEYEVILQNPGVRETQWGDERLELTMVIRKDVEQPCQGRLIFHSLSRKKQPNADDTAIGGYSAAMLQQIAVAAQLPEGASYANLDAVLRALAGRSLRATVKNEVYQGKTYLRVKAVEPSKFAVAPAVAPTVDEDDLPF